LEKPSWNPNWPARKADKVVTNYFSIFEGADRPLLKDNGGTSCTHALKAGSPALDMAWTGRPGEHPFACAQFDQRWAERPSTWTGTGCDAGAFERTGQVQPSGLGCR
jgi:hypothetical protein